MNLIVLNQPFYIVTNSTVSQLTFNSTSQTVSFTVSGPSGTTGFVNMTISKALIQNITGLQVNLDGNNINYTLTSNNYYWNLQFTYHHSTHDIVVSFESTETAVPSPTTSTSQSDPSPTQTSQSSGAIFSTSTSTTLPTTSLHSDTQPTPTNTSPPSRTSSPTITSTPQENSATTKSTASNPNLPTIGLIIMSVLLLTSLLLVAPHRIQKTAKLRF